MNKGIQKMFSGIPNTYEFLNHLFTWGLDILLRKKAAKIASGGGGKRWIDVCSGTGETAAYLRQNAVQTGLNDTIIVAADFTLPMLKKIAEKPEAKGIACIITDAGSLPFRRETFDVATISFATRNINVTPEFFLQCLREFHRILGPGGKFINLETSQPSSWILRTLFHLYIRTFVKYAGALISGSAPAYAYLAHTIPRFYNAADFAEIIRTAGFAEVSFERKFLGIAAIHKAIK